MKKKNLLIAGCGYLGLELGRYATRQGCSVWGIRRSRENEDEIKSAGIKPLFLDLLKVKNFDSLPPLDYVPALVAPALIKSDLMSDYDYVVACQAPGKNRSDYRSVYLDATRNLICALGNRPIKKFLWVSSTSVYGDFDGAWVDESTPTKADSENAKILLEAETLVLKSPFPSIVLRLSGIYGPGRNPLHLIEKGLVSLDAQGYTNHIHVADAGRLAYFLLECGKSGQIYLGVDDEPVLRSEFYSWLARGVPSLRGLAAKQPGRSNPCSEIASTTLGMSSRNDRERKLSSRRCSNQKIKSLGFQFLYPTFREGLTPECHSEGAPQIYSAGRTNLSASILAEESGNR